jgi:hypothetical protein
MYRNDLSCPSSDCLAETPMTLTASKTEAAASPGTIRQDLVARVRLQIAAGTYDSPERWDAALDCLCSDLSGE